MPFRLSRKSLENLTFLSGFRRDGGTIFSKPNIYFQKKILGLAEMEFSDFVIKKQIQSGQIMKRLVVFAVACRKFIKFILEYREPKNK